jgi:hypothetical protein
LQGPMPRRATLFGGRIRPGRTGDEGSMAIMKRCLAALLVIMGCFAFVGPVLAQDARDLARERKFFRNFSGEGSASISSLCIEGHVFVLVSGNLSNQSTLTQVYEEREGKVVPKRCEAGAP